MSRTQKVILGMVTLWPVLYMAIFFLFIIAMFLLTLSGGPTAEPPVGLFFLIFPLHFLTMLLMLVLLFIYIVNVFNNDRVAPDKKALWAVVLFLGNIIAMIIYWYLYIWSEPTDQLQER